MRSVLELKNVRVAFGNRKPLFDGLNLTLGGAEGTVVGLAGPSGSGKTTLLRLLLGLRTPNEGYILVPDGVRFGYVPQEPILFPQLSIAENASLLGRVGRDRARFDNERFERLIRALALKNIANASESVHNLSGGERQRLSLLRALSVAPNVLLLDEPCSGLDSTVKQQFLATLADSLAEVNALAVYVTHHVEELVGLAERIVFLAGFQSQDQQTRVFEQSTREFLSMPPCLGAAIMANYPHGQKISLQSLARLAGLQGGLADDEGWAVVRPENILSGHEGTPAIVLGQQGLYVRTEMRETCERLLLAPEIACSVGDELRLRLSGSVPCYDLDEGFIGYARDEELRRT